MFRRIEVKTSTFMFEHPRLFSIAMGFAVTLGVGIVIGTIQEHKTAAMMFEGLFQKCSC